MTLFTSHSCFASRYFQLSIPSIIQNLPVHDSHPPFFCTKIWFIHQLVWTFELFEKFRSIEFSGFFYSCLFLTKDFCDTIWKKMKWIERDFRSCWRKDEDYDKPNFKPAFLTTHNLLIQASQLRKDHTDNGYCSKGDTNPKRKKSLM